MEHAMSSQAARVISTPEGADCEAFAGRVGGCKAIDLVYLARQSLGDKKLEVELLELYDRQAAQVIDRLSATRSGGELRWQRDLAHTLTGSSRAVGAFAVAAASEAYEAVLFSSAGDSGRATALQILQDEITIARASIAHLLG
jgi:HPt (histidine-containing phosphotransfer) domain-containing protein